MTKASRSMTVPRAMQARFEEIIGITDAFCDQHLDAEYKELARWMTAALCRKRPSPVTSGKPVTWASGIIWALGRVNFLSDPSTPPSMTLAEVASAFGVGESTVSAKSRAIMDLLDLHQFHPDWTLPRLAESNPYIWMAEVNGLLVDLRDMPREVQVIAFEKGMIPYIPADREA